MIRAGLRLTSKPCFQIVDCWVLIEKYSHNAEIKEYTHENYMKVAKIYVYVRANDTLGKFFGKWLLFVYELLMLMMIESYPSCFVLLLRRASLKTAGNGPGALLNREKD